MDEITLNKEINCVAYVSDQDTVNFLKTLGEGTQNLNMTVSAGDIRSAIEKLPGQEDYEYLIVDITGAADPVRNVEQLAEVVVEGTHVVIVGTHDSVQLYHDLTDMGVADYLIKPLSDQRVLNALVKSNRAGGEQEEDKDAIKNTTVSVLSTRLNLVTASLPANLAYILAKEHKLSTCILDLNVDHCITPIILNVEPNHGLIKLLFNMKRADDLYVRRLFIEKDPEFYVLCGNTEIGHEVPLEKNDIKKLISLLQRIVNVLIIDIPYTAHLLYGTTVGLSNKTIFASDYSLVGIRDTARVLHYLTDNMPSADVDMVVCEDHQVSLDDVSKRQFEKSLGKKVDFTLEAPGHEMMTSINMGQTFVELKPMHPYTQVMREIANTIHESDEEVKSSGSIFDKILPMRK